MSFFHMLCSCNEKRWTACQVLIRAAAGLQEQHARGKVVKVRPSRLCLTMTGALCISGSSARQAEIEDKLYASPEELLSKPLEAASDIYSLVSTTHLNSRLRACYGSSASGGF